VILLPNTNNIKAKEIVKRIKFLATKETIDYVQISVSFGYETRRKTINAIITTLNRKDKKKPSSINVFSNYGIYKNKRLLFKVKAVIINLVRKKYLIEMYISPLRII
jgi:hypothetical protein